MLILPMLVPLGIGLSVLSGGRAPTVEVTVIGVLVSLAFSIFPGSAMGEEIGWRGFALPHLQADRSALSASLILGALWGSWHLPLYLIGSVTRPPSLFPAFVLAVVASSVILTWMYNGTGGSLLVVVLLHATSNLPLTLLITPLGAEAGRPFLMYVALLVVAVVAVVAATGPANLSRTRHEQVATP